MPGTCLKGRCFAVLTFIAMAITQMAVILTFSPLFAAISRQYYFSYNLWTDKNQEK